jgi:hypothetical protein
MDDIDDIPTITAPIVYAPLRFRLPKRAKRIPQIGDNLYVDKLGYATFKRWGQPTCFYIHRVIGILGVDKAFNPSPILTDETIKEYRNSRYWELEVAERL